MEEKEAIKGKVHELSDLWNKLFENEVELVKIDPEQSVMRSLLTFKYERKDTYYKMFDGEFYINKTANQIKGNEEEKRGIFIEFSDIKFNFTKAAGGENLIEDMNIIVGERMRSYNIKINISPLFRLHCLVIPEVWEKHPQYLSPSTQPLFLGLLDVLGDLRVVDGERWVSMYNSIGGCASINHLHFHLFELNSIANCFPHEHLFLLPIQRSLNLHLLLSTNLANDKGVSIGCNESYPIVHFIIKLACKLGEEEIQNIGVNICYIILGQLSELNIAYNLLMMREEEEMIIYVIPRKDEITTEGMGINSGILEICGVAICRNLLTYEQFDSEKYGEFLKKYISLDKKIWTDLKDRVVISIQRFLDSIANP